MKREIGNSWSEHGVAKPSERTVDASSVEKMTVDSRGSVATSQPYSCLILSTITVTHPPSQLNASVDIVKPASCYGHTYRHNLKTPP
jgi:hypothetical protein